MGGSSRAPRRGAAFPEPQHQEPAKARVRLQDRVDRATWYMAPWRGSRRHVLSNAGGRARQANPQWVIRLTIDLSGRAALWADRPFVTESEPPLTKHVSTRLIVSSKKERRGSDSMHDLTVPQRGSPGAGLCANMCTYRPWREYRQTYAVPMSVRFHVEHRFLRLAPELPAAVDCTVGATSGRDRFPRDLRRA